MLMISLKTCSSKKAAKKLLRNEQIFLLVCDLKNKKKTFKLLLWMFAKWTLDLSERKMSKKIISFAKKDYLNTETKILHVMLNYYVSMVYNTNNNTFFQMWRHKIFFLFSTQQILISGYLRYSFFWWNIIVNDKINI